MYNGFWCTFLQSRGCEADLILYQCISDAIFKELAKQQYPLQEGGEEQVQRVLSYEEKTPFDTLLTIYMYPKLPGRRSNVLLLSLDAREFPANIKSTLSDKLTAK